MRFSLLVVAIIPLFAFAGPASAASPADFESCQQMQDLPRSIDGCSKIADDQSETARNRAVALFDRGVAYYSKDDTDHAITDWTEAIKLDSNYGHAYNNRAKAFLSKADYDHAIADYGEAIKLDPDHAVAYKGRGIAYLLSGATDKAQADFQKAADLEPSDAYAALWLDIADRRNNVPSRLAQATTHLNMAAWPAPVVLLYADQMTPHEVLVSAQNINPVISQARLCDAYFYGGELMLLKGQKDQAAHAFGLALKGCAKTVDEFSASFAELKALGRTP